MRKSCLPAIFIGLFCLILNGTLINASPLNQVGLDYRVREFAVNADRSLLVATGKLIANPNTPDGYQYPIDVIDLSTGQIINTIDTVWPFPFHLNLNPNGDLLVYATLDANIEVLNPQTGLPVVTIYDRCTAEGCGVEIDDLLWNPVDDRIAIIIGRGIAVVNGDTGEQYGLMVDTESRGLISATAWDVSGIRLATTTAFRPEDGSQPISQIQIWDVPPLDIEFGHPPSMRFEGGGGTSLAWSPDGSQLASNGRGIVRVYDIVTGQETMRLTTGNEVGLSKVIWSPDGSKIAAGGVSLYVWDVTTQQLLTEIVMPYPVDNLEWSLDSQHIFHNGGDEGIYQDGVPLSQTIVTPTPDTIG